MARRWTRRSGLVLASLAASLVHLVAAKASAPGSCAGAEACGALEAGSSAERAGNREEEVSALLQHTQARHTKPHRNSLEEAYRSIGDFARFVRGINAGRSDSTEVPGVERAAECVISETQSCLITSFKQDAWTVIDPTRKGSPFNRESNLRCLDGSPFKFKFYRGSSKRLLVFMMGGGACWNKWSSQGLGIPRVFTTGPMCQPNLGVNLPFRRGPLNTSNPHNPYRHHSILLLPTCSGDGFAGDAVQEYRVEQWNSSSPFVHQKGYHHADAALQWLQGNRDFSHEVELDDFSLQGCSSGAIGVQIWANELLSRFKHRSSRVVVDSYAGLFPQERQAEILGTWGVCDLPILSPEQQAECSSPSGLFILNLTENALRNHPSTQFIGVNAKTDRVQRLLHTVLQYQTELDVVKGILTKGTGAYQPMGEVAFYKQLNEQILRRYAAYDNWQSFLVEGSCHCFVGEDFEQHTPAFVEGGWYTSALGWLPPASWYTSALGGEGERAVADGDTDSPNGTGSAEGSDVTVSGDGEMTQGESPVLTIAGDVEHINDGSTPPFICAGELTDPETAGNSTTYCDSSLR